MKILSCFSILLLMLSVDLGMHCFHKGPLIHYSYSLCHLIFNHTFTNKTLTYSSYLSFVLFFFHFEWIGVLKKLISKVFILFINDVCSWLNILLCAGNQVRMSEAKDCEIQAPNFTSFGIFSCERKNDCNKFCKEMLGIYFLYGRCTGNSSNDGCLCHYKC